MGLLTHEAAGWEAAGWEAAEWEATEWEAAHWEVTDVICELSSEELQCIPSPLTSHLYCLQKSFNAFILL